MNRFLVLVAAAALSAGCGDSAAPEGAAVPEMATTDHPNAKLGALQVTGDTRDFVLITSKAGKAYGGNPPLLGETIELEPGEYVVDLNKTTRTVTLGAGKKVVLASGSVLVTKKGAGFWFPMQGDENRYATNPPNSGAAISLFPGTFDIYVNEFPNNNKVAEGVKVVAGRRVTLNP
jgi:hypothetical protein